MKTLTKNEFLAADEVGRCRLLKRIAKGELKFVEEDSKERMNRLTLKRNKEDDLVG
jgi:hypothetical protein